MRSDSSHLTPAAEDIPKEPLLRWLGSNVLRLTIYLAVASFGVSFVTFKELEPREDLLVATIVFFFYGGLLGIPGTLVWLFFVAKLPPEWSTVRRRVVAMATSPFIQVISLLLFIEAHAYTAAAIFGSLLPAGAALVVRLRDRRPSSFLPEE